MASGYARISMAKCFSCFLQFYHIPFTNTSHNLFFNVCKRLQKNNCNGFCFPAEEWWLFSDCVETFLFLIHRQIGILNN